MKDFNKYTKQLDDLIKIEKPTDQDYGKLKEIISDDNDLAAYFHKENTNPEWLDKLNTAGEFKQLEDADIAITRDKGLVYGTVLIDDYPEYIKRWLEWRPRSLVVMPQHDYNKGFTHPQVIIYDNTNLAEVKEAMGVAKDRE